MEIRQRNIRRQLRKVMSDLTRKQCSAGGIVSADAPESLAARRAPWTIGVDRPSGNGLHRRMYERQPTQSARARKGQERTGSVDVAAIVSTLRCSRPVCWRGSYADTQDSRADLDVISKLYNGNHEISLTKTRRVDDCRKDVH